MGNIFPLSIHWHIVCVCVDVWICGCGHVGMLHLIAAGKLGRLGFQCIHLEFQSGKVTV